MVAPRIKNAPIERINDLLDYSPETGIFRWKRSRGRQRAGSVAGSVTGRGYRYISIDGAFYLAQRLAWLLMTGGWPEFEVDHRNRKRDDNRWRNLRAATSTQNKQNSSTRIDNTSGHTGVIRARGGWQAYVFRNSMKIYVGWFKELGHAAAARRIAASGVYGEFSK